VDIIVTAVLSALGGAGISLAIAIFVMKKWVGVRIEESVKHEYAKKLEDYKFQLQEEFGGAVRKAQIEIQEAADERNADKDLLLKLLEVLPSSGNISYIGSVDMAGVVERGMVRQLQEFFHEWKDPEHSFLDKDIESIRAKLHEEVGGFLNYMAVNTYVTGSVEYVSVSKELLIRRPEKFQSIVAKLHELADRVVETHKSLVILGKRKLKC